MADKQLRSISFPGLEDRYIIPEPDTTLTESGIPADAKKVGDELSDLKEDFNELESDGVVASAEQLLSDKYTIDQVPYHYRASGGNGADREYDEIVGGSIAWNQTVKDPLLTDTSKIGARNATFTVSDGVATCTPSSDGTERGLTFACDDFVYGHKYFIGAMVKPSVSGYMAVGASGNASIPRPSITANVWQLVAVIYNRTVTGAANLASFYQYNSITTNDTIQYKKPQCIDLTALFGSEIADYIYSIEQATAGAGVAWFKKLFPNDYYEYNAGTLISVSGLQSHDMVGFNLWDEEWESGYINDNGENVVSAGRIRSKNYIPCIPDAQYYFECGSHQSWYQIAFYDSSKTYINHLTPNTNAVFTTLSNARYMRFAMNDRYGKTYKNDICINLSSDRNGEYEPYEKHSYALDNSLTLRGVPKLDSNNQIYFDGDTYAADGTVTRKYRQIVLDGSDDESWMDYSNYNGFVLTNTGLKVQVYGDGLCDKIPTVKSMNSFGIVFGVNSNYIFFPQSQTQWGISTVNELKAYLAEHPLTIVAPIPTPTTEEGTPFTNPQKVDPYGTEEYVTTSIVPVGHYTKYPENLRAKIENLDLSMIAPIESGTTASQAYAVGKYFLLNNKFCKAKTAIASGATFTLNTNYEVTTVADELYTALNA